VPLSVEVSVIHSVGACECGVHGNLTSIALHSGDAEDATKAYCSACLPSDVHRMLLMVPESSVRRAPGRQVKKRSQKQERTVMAGLPGGRAQAGSGSRPGYKGDGRVYDRIRVEMKSTTKKDMSIVTRDVLNKIRGECEGHEEPIVVVDFAERSTGRVEDQWALIELKVLERILNATALDDS